MKKILLKYGIGIAGLIVGIIGLIMPVNSNQFDREPFFIIEPLRTEIVDGENISETTLTIMSSEGEIIEKSVISARFYIWNNGEQSIKADNLLKDLIVKIGNDESEIIDYKILNISRDVIGLKVLRTDDKNSLRIKFDILEKDDGTTIQIIYTGNIDDEITLEGIIEGVKVIKGKDESEDLSKRKLYMVMSFGGLFAFVVNVIFIKLNKKYSKVLLEAVESRIVSRLKIIGIVFRFYMKYKDYIDVGIITIIVVILLCELIGNAAYSSIMLNIPKSVKP